MFTVLIADDEKKVAMLIQTLIDWQGLGLGLAGIARDGLEALEMIRRSHPDIVVTDIRMPKMDGLALIEEAQAAAPETGFVVISGHRQFEYAHRALRYGVQDYILKPIDAAELNGVLARIVETKRLRRRQDVDLDQARNLAVRTRSILFSGLSAALLADRREPMERVNQRDQLNFREGCFLAASLRLDLEPNAEPDERQDSLVCEWIFSRMERELADFTHERLAGLVRPRTIGLIANFSRECEPEILRRLSNLLLPVGDYLGGYGCYAATLGIGGVRESFAEAGESLSESLNGLDERIRLGTGRVVQWTASMAGNGDGGRPGTGASASESTSAHLAAIQAEMQKHVGAGDGKALGRTLRSAVEQAAGRMTQTVPEKTMLSGAALYAFARELSAALADMMPGDAPGDEATKRLSEAIDDAQSVERLSELLRSSAEAWMESAMQAQALQACKPVRSAKTYIARHFSEHLTLEDVAREVALNPNYFSTLFRKETGETFIDYLTGVRLEAAKMLLRTTGSTVASISEEVGYRDVKHFCKTFARLVGLNPTQYRRLYS